MENQLVYSIYNEMADHLDAKGKLIKDMDNATYIRHINLIKDDLNSTSEQQRTAAFQLLRIFVDNTIHSIQTDALELLSAANIDLEQKKSILSPLGMKSIQTSLANQNIEDLATLNASWNASSTQFAEILTNVVADAQHRQQAKDILLNVLLPYILDANNIQNESMDSRINLAVEFASAIPVAALTKEESDRLTADIDKHIETISQLRNQNIVYWHKLWIFFVRWYGTKLHDSLNLVNKLLRVVESAFRSSSSEQRVQGYDCWKELISNAGLNVTYLSSPRQLKLILTPLKAKFSKREPLITKRFELFGFLLEKLQDRAVVVLKEFVEFCFGETANSVDVKRSGFVRRLPELCLECMEILLFIIGHSHENNENCLSATSGVHLRSPVVNSDNIDSVFSCVLEGASECSKCLKNVPPGCNKVHVLKCLWRSLLRLILHGQNQSNINERLRLLGTVLNNLLKGNDPNGQSIAGIIFEETVAMGKDTALVLVMNQLDNFLNVIFTGPFNNDRCKQVRDFLAMFDNLEGVDVAKLTHHMSAGFIQYKTKQQNVDCVRDVWVYAVNKLTDYAKGNSLDFLLWPVLYLQPLEENDYAIVCEHYKRQLVPFVENSDELMLAFFKQLEKTVKNNPLLLGNVLTILKMFSAKPKHREITDVTFKMLDWMLSMPITGGNKDHVVAEIEVLVTRQLSVDLSIASHPGIIQNVCTCIQSLLKQKHYLALPYLESLLRDSTEATKPLYLKSLDADFLTGIRSKETEATTEAIPRILQMINLWEVKQDPPAAALALKGRSAKIAKLVKEIPQSPPKVSSTSDILKYFGKNLETTPKKIMGSQLHKPPAQSPKNTPTSQQKKKNQTRIDDESESKFVLIETEVKVDKNNLTDHQIETLAKRREDIPALYQDLSQSVSQSFDCPPSANTQCFKKPFELNGGTTEELAPIQQESATPESVAEPNKDQELIEPDKENGTADLEPETESVDPVPNTEQENGKLVGNFPADGAAEVEPASKEEVNPNISKAGDEDKVQDNVTSAKKPISRIDLELKKLCMNLVGADGYFSVGSKRNRRSNRLSEPTLRKRRTVDVAHVTADSKTRPSQKLNSETQKQKKDRKENKLDSSESDVPRSPKRHRLSVLPPDQPQLDKSKQASSAEMDESRKIRKTKRVSLPSKKLQDSNLKGNVGKKSSSAESSAESLIEEDKPLSAFVEKMEIDDRQAVVSNGEAKAEGKTLNKEGVQTPSGKKRKRASNSDCDDDIIESSQEPSSSKKEARTPARVCRSSTIEAKKSTNKKPAAVHEKRSSGQTISEVIEAVVRGSGSCTESQSSHAGSAKKRKVKAIVCKLLNFSAPTLTEDDNDHTYVLTNKINVTNGDADNKNVACKDPPLTGNTPEKEPKLKTEISPKMFRQLLETDTEAEVPIKAESETGNVPKSPRQPRSSETLVVRKSPRKQKDAAAAEETAALAEPTLSTEELVKRTQSQDTETQDSEKTAAAGIDAEIQLEVPQKAQMTNSEQEIAEMQTVSMTSTDLGSACSIGDLVLYINDTLVEDTILSDTEMSMQTLCDDGKHSESLMKANIIKLESDPGTPDMQVDVSSLPSSPVTVETPNRNAEFLNSTVDISPISFKSKSDSEDEQVRKTKLVPIALKFETEEEQQKSPEKADDAPLKSNEVSTEDAAKESDSHTKLRVIDDQNREVKSADKLSGIGQATLPGKRIAGRRKTNYMSPSVSRIKKLMAKVHPQSQIEEIDASNPDDILTFSRAVPSPLATPKSGILKRKHPDIPDDEVTPCAKRKRVNFSDPCTTSKKVFLKYDSASPQRFYPDDDLDRQFLEVLAANIENCPSTEAELADCSVESVSSLPRREDAPIYPDLVNCEENIGVISRKLTAPMFVNTLLTKLNGENVKTIGDLARLSEASIDKLPFKSPMVPTVFKVLDCYYHKNFKSKGNVEVALDAPEAAPSDKSLILPSDAEDLENDLSKIVEKAISAKIPPKTICSVVLRSLDQKHILTWFKEDLNVDVKDLVEESEFSGLVTHITKALGVPKLINILTNSPETTKDFKCHLNQLIKKSPLAGILERRSLDEVQTALWESVDKKVFSKNDLLQTCFLSRITVLDLNAFFNKLTVVELGDIILKRLATEPHEEFVRRIVNHVEESLDTKIGTLNNFDIADLTSSIIQRGTPQEIISSFTCMFLSAEKTSEDLVQIFRLVCDHLADQLPPSQLMELAIDFLRKIPTRK